MKTFYTVQQKSSQLFLNIRIFDFNGDPVFGPIDESWLAHSKEQAIAQASFLDDCVACSYRTSRSACASDKYLIWLLKQHKLNKGEKEQMI